jgi:branched-chain amino acid transport system substrate-binding protein
MPDRQYRTKTSSQTRRRQFIRTAGVGATALLAGCQTREDGPSSGGASSGGAGGAQTGNIGKGPLSGKTIKVGSLSPNPSGWPVGTGVEEGALMAIEDINRDGGLLGDTAGVAGADLELHTGDTALAPATGRREYRRLIQQKDVDFTTGVFFDRVLLQIFPPMSENEKIHMSTASPGTLPAELVHKRYDDFKYHFRTGPINAYDLAINEINFLKVWSERANWDRVAVLVENIAPFDPFWEHIVEDGKIDEIDGIEVPIKKRTSSGQSDWTAIYNELEDNNIDFAAINFVLTGQSATVQWADQERQFEMGGINVPSQSSSFWEETNGRAEYMFCLDAHTPHSEQSPYALPFSRGYVERFDRAPVYTAGLTYDAIHIYAQAVKNAVEAEGLSEIPEGDLMVKYLEEIQWPKSTVFAKDQFEFRSKDKPHRAHDPNWTDWEVDGVPLYQQWQHPDRGAQNESVSRGEGVMECFAPDMTATSNYQIPRWIDKEIDFKHEDL